MKDIQNLHETQISLELIHEAYSIMAKKKGLVPCELYFHVQMGNQIARQINQDFINALNKYMLTKGFNGGFKPLWDIQVTHNKIINQ